jgi:GNAT superfamily N-acetyltransferase
MQTPLPDAGLPPSGTAASGVRMRAARSSDLAALGPIEVAAAALFSAGELPPSLAQPTPLATLQACLAASELWVAAAHGCGPVGFAAARTHGSCLHLLEMDVLPSHSRQGIGTRLLRHVCQVATQRGHLHVTLTTFAHLPWNVAFYAANGFTALSDCADFPHLAAALKAERDSGLDARIAMVRRLAPHNALC